MLHKLNHIYGFGTFTLNVTDRVLRHGEREVRLGSTAFDLLVVFVAHPGTLFSREELKQAVWGTENIEDNNVDQRIAEVRRALACDRNTDKYVQNVRGHGWRFVEEVTERREALLSKEGQLPERAPVPVTRRKPRPLAVSPNAGWFPRQSRPLRLLSE
jgi:DNA-binding winged helix-turn-helix (wHTH) protein